MLCQAKVSKEKEKVASPLTNKFELIKVINVEIRAAETMHIKDISSSNKLKAPVKVW